MFKIKIVAFLFCLTSTIANAETFQINRAIVCDKIEEVIKLVKKYGEKPIWQGKNNQGLQTVLTLNAQTKTWSLLLTDGELACILDAGPDFTVEKSISNPKAEKNNLTDVLNKYKI